jgi:tetratricopeptide (TPR) repeat protein
MLVTLPFVMIILDYWPLQRFNLQNSGVTSPPDKQLETKTAEKVQKKNRRSANITKLSKFKQLNAVRNWHILEKIPFFIIAVGFSIIAMYTQYASSFKDFPLSSRILNAIISYVIYLEKTFWPRDLAVFYPFPDHFVLWQLMGALLLLLLISVAAIVTAKRFQFLIAGWLWFVITLLPVSGIIQVGLHSFADRYTYLPSIGIGIIIAWGIPNIIPTEKLRKIILPPAAILILVILAILTWRQCGYWESSIELFSHTLQVTKSNYLAHANLGDAFADAGEYNDAVGNYKEAIKINPDYLNAHYNLANVLAEQGEVDEAISQYREVIRIDPYYYPALNNLGQNLIKQGKRTEAVSYLKRALEIEPNDANVHLNLGEALLGLGEPKEAIKHLRTALRLMPDFADAQKLLWRALELENKQKK